MKKERREHFRIDVAGWDPALLGVSLSVNGKSVKGTVTDLTLAGIKVAAKGLAAGDKVGVRTDKDGPLARLDGLSGVVVRAGKATAAVAFDTPWR